ncbi:MAG: flagellar basal body L-ring protein FlgH [Thermotogae bacterium]|nr:flagellar basal body L-ring protein FlgH [Thermotogota bacterium]MCP5465459.1 flagellar basal body L-ring protein FlgH [Thermotogota bacterium]HOO74508.1 flagellar basal body L-ring protein FlgH [Tepiditoga sp.]
MHKKITVILFSFILISSLFSESLWKNASNQNSILSDRKSYKVGDIITVMVLESPTLSLQDSNPDYKTNSVETLGSLFKTIGGVDLTTFLPLASADPTTLNSVTNKQNTSSSQASIKMYISSKITENNNGILKIRGEREIKIGNDRRTMIIEGEITPDSIDSKGYVESSNIAGAKIWYDGDVVFQQDPNENSWISWLLSGISNIFF